MTLIYVSYRSLKALLRGKTTMPTVTFRSADVKKAG
jgi:hypothetical protein